MYDLLIKGGRVIDPSQNLDGLLDLGITNGRVAQLANAIDPSEARLVIDATGLLVTPGLIDMHVHVHWGVSQYGVDADLSCLARGVTTAVEAGSAGAYTSPSLKRFIIDKAQTRILAFLNIAYFGMIGDQVGELEDPRFTDKELAIRIGQAPEIVGLKVRTDRVGDRLASEPLRSAVEIAEALGKPIMVHIGRVSRMHVPLSEILGIMRPGDIITHTYHGFVGGIVDENYQLRPEVQQARERGILFDVGHGGGSFTFATAKAAIDQGFIPDMISTDLHTYSIAGPVFDMPTTMSKFLHLGMSLEQVIAHSTWVPAKILGLEEEIGTLKPGAQGDVAVLKMDQGAFPLYDCVRQTETASRLLSPVYTIKAGHLSTMGPGIR